MVSGSAALPSHCAFLRAVPNPSRRLASIEHTAGCHRPCVTQRDPLRSPILDAAVVAGDDLAKRDELMEQGFSFATADGRDVCSFKGAANLNPGRMCKDYFLALRRATPNPAKHTLCVGHSLPAAPEPRYPVASLHPGQHAAVRASRYNARAAGTTALQLVWSGHWSQVSR